MLVYSLALVHVDTSPILLCLIKVRKLSGALRRGWSGRRGRDREWGGEGKEREGEGRGKDLQIVNSEESVGTESVYEAPAAP